jgi:transposase
VARYLEMTKRQHLERLLDLEWPERRIARELGIHRKTVRRHAKLRRAKCTKTPTDSVAAEPGEDAATAEATPPVRRRPFRAAVHHADVAAGVEAGDTAQVIYQYLVDEHGCTGSYDSVKRYVRHLKANRPKPVVGVMHHAPGEEGQVDYFLGAPTFGPVRGGYRRPWVFRMTLRARASHLPASAPFGGVPAVIRHDNMTSGVSRACYYDPDSNTKYLAFSRHWGFAPLPTKPYTPREKGKDSYCTSLVA